MFNGRFIYGISLFASKVNKKDRRLEGKGMERWRVEGGDKYDIALMRKEDNSYPLGNFFRLES